MNTNEKFRIYHRLRRRKRRTDAPLRRIEKQKQVEKFLVEKVATELNQLLSNENLQLDLDTSRELFSLTGGGIYHNGEYVPVKTIKIAEALKKITIPES